MASAGEGTAGGTRTAAGRGCHGWQEMQSAQPTRSDHIEEQSVMCRRWGRTARRQKMTKVWQREEWAAGEAAQSRGS
eukprot:6195290-Pleurochrysis_carterae.AAC.2